jgi:hypothetical protein
MPRWNSAEGATNRWTLSALVEDEKGQRVESNTIELQLTEPVIPPAENSNTGWTLPDP